MHGVEAMWEVVDSLNTISEIGLISNDLLMEKFWLIEIHNTLDMD